MAGAKGFPSLRLGTGALRTGPALARPSRALRIRILPRIKKYPPDGGYFFMAGAKGFEPSIFSVTGRRVNRATPRTHA